MINQPELVRFRVAFIANANGKIQVGNFSNVTPGRPLKFIYSVVHWAGSRANQKLSDRQWSFLFGEYSEILIGSTVKHTTCDEQKW